VDAVELTELAQNYFGDTRSGSLAGPIGAFVIGALAVTTVLLIRNMNARLRRLPERFPAPPPAGADPTAGTDPAAGTDPVPGPRAEQLTSNDPSRGEPPPPAAGAAAR
jgi:hypothetical protein